MKDELVLYTYFRSSAAYRVRIALNLKGLKAQMRSVHLLRDGGEQHQTSYRALNSQGLVPTLVHGGHRITQSLAILEYLDDIVAEPRLLPVDILGRARVRALAAVVASDIHPLNNLRVLKYLGETAGLTDACRRQWQEHWIREGFEAIELLLSSQHTGLYCHGDTPCMADVCLIPQVYNARRIGVLLTPYPRI